MSTPIEEAQQQNNRAEYMDFLYDLYNRSEAPLGLKGTYTGLAEQHAQKLGKEWAEKATFRVGQGLSAEEIRTWHEQGETIRQGYERFTA